MNYYSAVKKNEALIYTATLRNLECITLSKRSQAQDAGSFVYLLHLSRNGKCRARKQNTGYLGLEVRASIIKNGCKGSSELTKMF